MLVKCEYCGKEFDKPVRRVNESIKNGWHIYCSLECKGKASRKKVECTCANCGKKIEKYQSALDDSKTGNVFCSKSCACSYNNEHFRTKENNPNWRGGKYGNRQHAKIAYRNYVPECAICGETDKYMLEVHHIDFNHSNNELDNLIILCANHHLKLHRGGLVITDEIKSKRKLK